MDIILFLSASLTLLLHGTLVLSEDEPGPTDEGFRRFLAQYEQQQQRRFYEQGGSNYPSNPLPGDYPLGQDSPVGDGGSFRTSKQDTTGPQLPSPTRSRWTGPGQPEVVAVDNRYSGPQEDEDIFLNMQVYTPQDRQQEERQPVERLTPGGSMAGGTTQEEPEAGSSDEQEQKQTKKSEQRSSQGPGMSSPGEVPFQALTAPAQANKNPLSDVYFVVIVAGCSAAAIFGVIAAGYCFYRFQKNSKAAAEVDYPAYGVTGPNKDQTSPNGDRRLAQSAQMYHYQHQKQQMIAVEKATTARNTSASDIDSEEENEDGDYTVYECPGLAPTGEMEVKNPLFQDDSTPMSPPVLAIDGKKP